MAKEKRNYEIPTEVIKLLELNKDETDQSLSGAISAAIYFYVVEMDPQARVNAFLCYKNWLKEAGKASAKVVHEAVLKNQKDRPHRNRSAS